MRVLVVVGIGLVVVTGLGQGAQAADLDLPSPPAYAAPPVQYDFGTGWYLRGDISAASEAHPHQDHTFGTLVDANADSWTYAVGAGVGYKWNNWFRTDVTGETIEGFSFNAQSVDAPDVDGHASFDRYAVMANAYFDLGTWYGITPYVGGGVGASIVDPTVSVGTQSYTVRDSAHLAWAMMAGLSYAVDNHVTIDLGYRHLDLGRYGLNLADYASDTVHFSSGAGFDRHFTRDEIRLGVRYLID